MFPWTWWFFAPQVHFPLSGDVAQRIDPVTRAFFRGIPAGAGDGRAEEAAFGVASYGRQLGLLTDVVLEMARAWTPTTSQGAEALARLRAVALRIEEAKAGAHVADVDELEARVRDLQAAGGPAFEAVRSRLAPLLAGPVQLTLEA